MIACDANQLHRIENSIAALECRSDADRMRLHCMLEALRLEQRKLLGVSARKRPLPSALAPVPARA